MYEANKHLDMGQDFQDSLSALCAHRVIYKKYPTKNVCHRNNDTEKLAALNWWVDYNSSGRARLARHPKIQRGQLYYDNDNFHFLTVIIMAVSDGKYTRFRITTSISSTRHSPHGVFPLWGIHSMGCSSLNGASLDACKSDDSHNLGDIRWVCQYGEGA